VSKSGGFDKVQIVINRIADRPESIFDAADIEVRLFAGLSQVRMGRYGG
jgi:hypothetical protein